MMRPSTWLLIAISCAACAARARMPAEPELAGAASPAAFHRAIGLTLLRTDQPRQALPHLQRLARIESGRPEPLCYLARTYMDLEMWQQARTALDDAIALAPRHAPAHALRGILLDARGDHAAAVAAHRRAIALDPGSAAYRNNLGFNRYLAGRHQEALAALEAALRLEPGLRRVHNNLGFVHGKLGRLEDAREHFRLAGTEAEAANNLGMVHEARGELERAHDEYRAALDQAPDLTVARRNLERVCERLGRPPPAPLDRRE